MNYYCFWLFPYPWFLEPSQDFWNVNNYDEEEEEKDDEIKLKKECNFIQKGLKTISVETFLLFC
jgi:hypothetical protein